ncbi:MAG: hypothetical protein WC227_00220 [Patescibacteria group bacterium]|jgi:hypothetical protein
MRSIVLATLALFAALLMSGCNGNSSISTPIKNNLSITVERYDGAAWQTVEVGESVFESDELSFDVLAPAIKRGGVDIVWSVKKAGFEITGNGGKSWKLMAGDYIISAQLAISGSPVLLRELTVKAGSRPIPPAPLAWNPVLRGYTPYSSANSVSTQASSYTLQRSGDKFLAKVGQKLTVEIDRTDHRGGPGDGTVDPTAPLYKEVKVVVVNNIGAEVPTTYEDYYWGYNGLLPVFTVKESGDFTAKVSIVLSDNTQKDFSLQLRVEDVVVDQPMTVAIKWHYYDGTLKTLTLTNNTLYVLPGNRYDIKASKPGWEGAQQEIVIFNEITQVSPPLMVGNDFIEGLMSGTGEGTVRVTLSKDGQSVHTDFHVEVIEGLGMVR